MESSDVIELNSSDDEAKEPAAKRMKHLSNAMVHIPSKLYDTTITPTGNKHKGVGKLAGTKIYNSANVSFQPTQKNKTNGRHLQKIISRPNVKKYVNPMNVASQNPLVFNKMLSVTKVEKHQLKGQLPKSINLPPSITITKTKRPSSGLKNVIPSSGSYIHVNKNLNTDFKTDFGTVTVDIDDEGSQSSAATASPQWYLRPEEQLNEESPEILNNKEPETTNMIEITIEDSPVKPCLPKELKTFITIEDSPIKLSNEPISDDVVNNEQDKSKIPLSKKKLDYPKNNEINEDEKHETETASDVMPEIEGNKVEQILENKETREGKDNPRNVSEEQTISTALKANNDIAEDKSEVDKQQNQEKTDIVQDNNVNKANENISEFHPIYQKFIDTCFELENSDDMKKIVDKKIKSYYKQVSKQYVESEEFLDMVSVKISLMKAGPEKMFLYIKDIVDELNIQRKMAKSQVTEKPDINTEGYGSITEKITEIFEEDAKYDRRRRRQIRKLEKTIKKLHRAIQKLEVQEVDFDDEDNSVYLLTERYKERLVRVHAKFCQITNSKMPSEPHIHIQPRPGQPPGPAKRLEKWINRKVPLGTPLPFPDFHDVLKCVRQANDEDRLGWNEADVMEEARDLFTRCGRKLQRRRQENEWRLATSLITQQGDPAEDNEALKKKLEENRREAAKKEADLVNKYADKQTQLKLEGVEIGDKEAEESPEESEDEEINDDSNSLDDKGKRKDRLRRLLEEKSKKSAESNKETECLSPNKDDSENVEKITEKDIFTENQTTEIDSINTSKDQILASSNQQSTICSVQSQNEATKVPSETGKDNTNKNPTTKFIGSFQNKTKYIETQNNMVEDNLATETTCNVQKIDNITEDLNNPHTPIMLTTLAQNKMENTKTQNNMDVDNLAAETICDAEKVYDITDEINNPDIPTMLPSSVQNQAENTDTQNNMDEDNLYSSTTCDAEKIEDIVEETSNSDTPIILTSSVQNETEDTENHINSDEDDIATEVICDSEKIEDIAEEISNPDTPTMFTNSVQNETDDAKFQNRMDKDNLATEVTSDTENEGTEEVRVKFEYDEHILISDDSDGDELNLLQKLHSGDDQSSSSESETKESSDAEGSPIAISDTLKSDSDDDNDDVISIENSTYSESESTKDDFITDKEIESVKNEVTYDLEEESQDDDRQETALDALPDDRKNYEANEDSENILLASSEDEDEDITNKDMSLSKYCGNYVNLKDDEISISETQLQKAGPTNYDMDKTGDCEISQTDINLRDENSSNSVKMSDDSKICIEEVILEDE